jgi:hypothetical protein
VVYITISTPHWLGRSRRPVCQRLAGAALGLQPATAGCTRRAAPAPVDAEWPLSGNWVVTAANGESGRRSACTSAPCNLAGGVAGPAMR